MSHIGNSDDGTIQASVVCIQKNLQVPPCVMAHGRKAAFGAFINFMAELYKNTYPYCFQNLDRPRWLRGRAFAWGTEGCGFDPQPLHTKSR